MNRCHALVIFIKAPIIGQVKTRLQPELTPKKSLLLYRALVQDLFSHIQNNKQYDIKVFYFPEEARSGILKWLGNQFEYTAQHGSDLGARMHHAFMQTFKHKYQKVIIIGSDIPTLNRSIILNGFSNLDNYDLILGPSTDGGYYLIGLKEPHKQLFENIEWSAEFVLKQTIKIAEKNNLSIMRLEQLTDIDTYQDVVQFMYILNKSKMNGKYSHLKNTSKVLQKIMM